MRYSLASVQLILSFLYFPLSPQRHLWGKSSCENWSVCNLLKQKQNITASSKGLDITTFKDMWQNTHTKQLQHTRMMTAEEATGRRNVFASKNPWNCVMSKRTRVALGAKGKMVFTAFFFFYHLWIISSKATVTPLQCDLRRFQTAEEIHDSSFIQLSNLPPILLLHIHHAHVRVQDWKGKYFFR